jgi:catechol 2,3-dioxygenase-like lactoylglutathione lyase family enzyme
MQSNSEEKTMFKKIDHVEIIPKEAERTINFYIDVLGFQLISRIKVDVPPLKEVIFLKLGESVIEIMSVDNPGQVSGHQWQIGYRAIAIKVENMTEAVKYLRDKNVVISYEPVDLGSSYRAEILDPDGLTIELRQYK